MVKKAQTEPRYLCSKKVPISEICPSQSRGMAWTARINPKAMIMARPGELGRSSNQEPLPAESSFPLKRIAIITPATIETAQKAKKAEAAAARSTSIRSGGFPAHVLRSIAELTAWEIPRWNPTTVASSIVDSSLLPDNTRKKVDIPTKANVKAPRFPMLSNNLYAIEIATAAAMKDDVTMARCMVLLPRDTTAPVLPIAAARAATAGRIRICAYPSFSIAPFAA